MFYRLPLFLCAPWKPPESLISLGGSPPPPQPQFPLLQEEAVGPVGHPLRCPQLLRAATAEDGSVPGLEVTAGWQALRNLWNVGLKVWGPFLLQEPPSSPLLSFHDFSPTVSSLNPNHCFSRVRCKSKPHASPSTRTAAKWKRVLGKNKALPKGVCLPVRTAGQWGDSGAACQLPGVGSEGSRSTCASDPERRSGLVPPLGGQGPLSLVCVSIS